MSGNPTPAATRLAAPQVVGGHRGLFTRLVPWAVGVVVVLLPFYFPGIIGFDDATTICAMCIIAMGQNVVTAMSGQLSLGQGAMAALGAYTYAVLVNVVHAPAVLAFVVSPLLPAMAGALISVWALRLRGLYLAMVTLAVVVAIPSIAKMGFLTPLTRGYQGQLLDPVEPPAVLSMLNPEAYLFCLSVPLVLLVALFVHRLGRSRQGLALRVMSDSELTALLSGVGRFRYRLLAFVVSAVLAGVGGELLGIVGGIVTPDSYSVLFSISFIVMIVLGGFGSSWGALIGAAALWEIQTRAAAIDLSPLGLSAKLLPGVTYGLLVVLVVVFLPGGILELLRRGTRACVGLVTHASRPRAVNEE